MSTFDPSTTVGSILINVVAGLLLAAILTGLAWVAGPLRWLMQNRRLNELLLSRRCFVFVFNPTAGQGKIVTFLENGDIGEGRNSNEYTWRVRKGRLEICAADGKLYSRFYHDKVSGYLRHTNDTDTRSIHGQYFQPDFMPWNRAAEQGVVADAATPRR